MKPTVAAFSNRSRCTTRPPLQSLVVERAIGDPHAHSDQRQHHAFDNRHGLPHDALSLFLGTGRMASADRTGIRKWRNAERVARMRRLIWVSEIAGLQAKVTGKRRVEECPAS